MADARASRSPESASPIDRRSMLGRLAAFVAGAVIGRAKPVTAAPASTLDGDPWIGEIALVPYNFAPRGWAMCDGQLLPIAQNTALFSLLGTTFGGDGQTNFALPDLRGRAPIHAGQGPGLANRSLGENGGNENVALNESQIPSHTHQAMASSFNGISDSPANAVPARDPSGTPQYGAAANTPMGTGAIAATGGSQPHDNMPPFLVMNYVIALEGIFPSRS